MPCGQPNHPDGTYRFDPETVHAPSDAVPDPTSPFLVVSNAPELLAEASEHPAPFAYPATLYRCSLPVFVTGGTRTIRLFVWHRNGNDIPKHFAVLMQMGTGAVSFVRAARAEVLTPVDDPQLLDAGLCLAKAQLFRTLSGYTPPNTLIDQNEKVFWAQSIAAAKETVCAVLELDVSAISDGSIDIRVVVSLTPGSYGTASDSVVNPANPSGGVHIRGSWLYSSVTCPAIVAPDISALPEKAQCVLVKPEPGAGAEVRAFAKRPGDTFGTDAGNKGLYGVNVYYRFELYNKPDPPYPDREARVFILSRNVGGVGKFWGAAQVSGATAGGVPKIEYHPDRECAALNPSNPIIVPVGTRPPNPVIGELSFATGGAAELPVNFCVANCDIRRSGCF